jgi:hypothetical protein
MSFTPTNALPQIPAIQRAVDPDTGKITAEWLRWLNLVKQRTDYLSVEGIIDARTIIEGTITVDTLPELSTMAGQITYPQMPLGAGTWVGSPTISGDVTISANLLPSLTDTSDLGSSTKQFRRGYISEINAVLFAKQTQQLYGGWLAVSKNAGTFASAVLSGDAIIDFGQAMTLNQFVLVRALDSAGVIAEEYIKVGALYAGTSYSVTRNLSGAGAKNWPAGTPYQVRGVAGDGWIELNAFNTPRMSIFSQGSAYNNSTELIRIGHLAGMPNGSSGIGFYAGDATNYIRWDGTNFKVVGAGCLIDGSGITLGSGVGAYDASGSLKFNRDGAFGVGAANVFGLWSQSSGGAYQDLVLENYADRGGLLGVGAAKSSVYIKATGWASGASPGTPTTPAQIRVRSEVGVSEVAITADTISASSGLFERGRSVRIGDWTGFNITGLVLNGTGTCSNISQGSCAYRLTGHTVIIQVYFGFDIAGAGAGDNILSFNLPAGLTGVFSATTVCRGATGFFDGVCAFYVAGTTLNIHTLPFGANQWTNGFSRFVQGQIEVQI